jgi:hypothetical protein
VHNWYRFVLAFPPHLVREYLEKFEAKPKHKVLDPFCGTGTTLVEAKKAGLATYGIEANPIAHLASWVKTNWDMDREALYRSANRIVTRAELILQADKKLRKGENEAGASTFSLPTESESILLSQSISSKPLQKVLALRDLILASSPANLRFHLLLALANTTVYHASNLRFGPEVGLGRIKEDVDVLEIWLDQVRTMRVDLQALSLLRSQSSENYLGDARDAGQILQPRSIDLVITSPPYPNEKDYTRTTRLESVVLGLVANKLQLRELKKSLLRSNTRGVYKQDDDDLWVEKVSDIQRIASEIEERRIQLGKTSGFERLYARVTKLYFGGMARHLASLRSALRPGARLAYVVGDQASYLQVMIRTGSILAEVAERLGYEVTGIDLFRTRLATATKQQLREEVVLLRWKGK